MIGTEWHRLRPGECALCGRRGYGVIENLPSKRCPEDTPMAEFVADELTRMSQNKQPVDLAVLSHASWLLRWLLSLDLTRRSVERTGQASAKAIALMTFR